MSLTAIFPIKEVKAILDHALNAPSFTNKHWNKKIGRSLYIVKDRGVYLMSNGQPILPDPHKEGSSLVVYAEGHNPDKDEDWWVGGDDFADPLRVEAFQEAISRAPDATEIMVKVFAKSIEVKAI